MHRVAVVDRIAIVRRGIRAVLEAAPELSVVAEAPDPADVVAAGLGSSLSLTLLDLESCGVREPSRAVAELAFRAPVLVMSASAGLGDVIEMKRAGAYGYLLKDDPEDAYVTAVRAVISNREFLSERLRGLQRAAIGARARPYQPNLSPREREVLGYVTRGFTHRQIASRMGVSATTIDTFVARIRSKLNVGNKAELALAGVEYLS